MLSPVASRAALHFLLDSEERSSEQRLINIVNQSKVDMICGCRITSILYIDNVLTLLASFLETPSVA